MRRPSSFPLLTAATLAGVLTAGVLGATLPGQTPLGPATVSAATTADTTLGTLCPNYNTQLLYRTFLEYPPTSSAADQAKAQRFGYNFAAVAPRLNATGFAGIRLGELGTQAVKHTQNYLAAGMQADVVCQLLPRLALLPDEAEPLVWNKTDQFPWAQQSTGTARLWAGEVSQTWGPDARDYKPAEKAVRDRCHDQPQHENNVGWTFESNLTSRLRENNPIKQAVTGSRVHPVTGASLGTGFTANRPMSATVRMHQNDPSGGFWYLALQFTNTSNLPYHLNCAVVWFVAPSSMSADVRNGFYANNQRPNSGLGHPQRDIVEIIVDEAQQMSVYMLRLDFHDEPWNMRTAYPNQRWGLEVGIPAVLPGGDWNNRRLSTAESRQAALDLTLSTLHVELESSSDPTNLALLNTLRLRNRMTN